MVIQSLNGVYLHAAWATSIDGDDFSLTEFPEATYCGSYSDNSSTESTNPMSYTWLEIGEMENDTEIDTADIAAYAQAQAAYAQAQTIINNDNIQASQDDTDMSTGNPNELIGTNQGDNNWTASAGLTISAQSGTIYNPNDEAVNYLHVACDTAGTNYIAFDASILRDKLAELTEDNSFTLSADINMSTVFDMPVMVSDTDGSNIQIDCGAIEPELVPVPEETADGLWVFSKSTADCENEVAVSSQVVLFDLSNMGAGETLDIANLKIEGGALATPWRASLDEVANIANQAYSVANNTQQHFWFQSTGLDTGAHITEKTEEEFISDPSNGGGNLLARSNGVAVRDGLNELATFYVDQLGRTVLDLLENNHGRITALYAGSNLDDTTISFYARNENTDKASLDLYAWENSPAAGIHAGSKSITANINGIYLEGGDVHVQDGDVHVRDGAIYLNNAKYLYSENTNNDTRSVIGINASNQLVIGYGLYANNEGTTYLEGNNVQILSKNDVKASNAGGTAHCVGTMDTMTTTQHSTSTGSVAATTDSGDKSATFTKAGYYPLGIVGINMAGTNRMYQNIYEYRLSSRSSGSATLTYRFRNGSSAAFSGTLYVDILWIKI